MEQMCQLPLVEDAMGRQSLALLRQLDAACASAADLEQASVESFNQHPDAGIITSFPGLGAVTGGCSPRPETTGPASPMLKASRPTPEPRPSPEPAARQDVTRRPVKNNRLAAPGYTWAFFALTASPCGRAHYDRRRVR